MQHLRPASFLSMVTCSLALPVTLSAAAYTDSVVAICNNGNGGSGWRYQAFYTADASAEPSTSCAAAPQESNLFLCSGLQPNTQFRLACLAQRGSEAALPKSAAVNATT